MAVEKKEEEEKLVVVGDGADEAPIPEKSPPEEKKQESAEVVEDDESSEESSEEEGDEKVGHSEEDEDPARAAIRERRRKERKQVRERTARERRELAFLRRRNEEVERKLSQIVLRQDQQEKVTVEQRVNTLESQINEASSIYDKAIINKDVETAAEARRVRDELVRARDSYKSKAAEKPDQEDAPAGRQPLINPESRAAFNQGKSWVERNEWFDPSLSDETSHIVKVMEDRLAAEGELSPGDPDYWKELDRRIARRFPELKKNAAPKGEFDEDDDEPAPRKKEPVKKNSGPRFSVGGKTRPLKPNEVYIDAERRKALEEAGVWEDEPTRERYLKSYQRYDEEARKNS